MMDYPTLKGKVCIVTGATRGIGRECVLAFSKRGCNVVVTGRSVTEKPDRPGTIYSVAKEAESHGVEALPFRIDMSDESTLKACVVATIKKFGQIDILINNAFAIIVEKIVDTSVADYDMVNNVNSRGCFVMTKLCLPFMEKEGYGRVITMSPPIDPYGLVLNTAQTISKYGMTLTAMGVSAEYRGKNITGNSLWPATLVESHIVLSGGWKRSQMRKASIMADCILSIIQDGTNGKMLIDEDYLLSKGLTAKDLEKYSLVPGGELLYITKKKNKPHMKWREDLVDEHKLDLLREQNKNN